MYRLADKIDAWKIETLNEEDYLELKREYNLDDFDFSLKNNPVFNRRNLIVGHENFDNWLKHAREGSTAIVSGFMTSGSMHLGSLAVVRQMAYYQKNYGTKIFIPIADIEAITVRNSQEKKVKEVMKRFLTYFSLGEIDLEESNIYLQSRNLETLRKAVIFTGELDIADVRKIYGRDISLAEIFSSISMISDILYPQIKGYDKTLTTLGIDEIDHFVLTKKLIDMIDGYSMPSITYNKMITGLNESKMGKSLPDNSIKLSDSPETAKKELEKLKGKDGDLVQNAAFNIVQWFGSDDDLREVRKESNSKKANNMAVGKSIEIVCDMFSEIEKNFDKHYNKVEKHL